MIEKFMCNTTTRDGRLTKGIVYEGIFVRLETWALSGTYWRIKIIGDNLGEVMTFDPDVFHPWG